MTDTLLDPSDTGEIPFIAGEDRTVVLRHDVGEATQNIAGWDAGLPPRLRRPDAHTLTDDTEVFIGWPTGAEVAVQQGLAIGSRLYQFDDLRPAAPNPGPLPPTPVEPNPNPPAPRPSSPGPNETASVSLLEALDPYGDAPDGYTGRHRDPRNRTAVEGEGRWGWLSDAAKPVVDAVTPGPRASATVLAIGAALLVWSAVTLAVLL